MVDDLGSKLHASVGRLPAEERPAASAMATSVLASGVTSIDEVLARLVDHNTAPATRVALTWAAGQTGDARAVPALRTSLSDPNPNLRREAVAGLGNLGATDARDMLISSLDQDSDPFVRAAAATALGQLGDAAAMSSLMRRLGDAAEATNVRVAAAAALPKVKDPRASLPLCVALTDMAPAVRFHAAAALADLGLAGAVPALRLLTRDRALLPGLGAVGLRAQQSIDVLLRR